MVEHIPYALCEAYEDKLLANVDYFELIWQANLVLSWGHILAQTGRMKTNGHHHKINKH